MVRNPFKKEKGSGEKFTARSALDRLEEEGFKPLIKGDVLDKRLRELKETFTEVIGKLATATTFKEKAEAVDKAHYLVFYVSSAWLRSMENEWLADKMNDFIEQYSEVRNIPEFLDMLLDEAKAIINLAFANIDVEPLRPILLQTGPKRIALSKEVEGY